MSEVCLQRFWSDSDRTPRNYDSNKKRSREGIFYQKLRRGILFAIFFICNLTGYFTTARATFPHLLQRSASQNYQMTKLVLIPQFLRRIWSNSSSDLYCPLEIACIGPNLQETSIKMSFTNLLNPIRPLEFEKNSFFCSKGKHRKR